MHTVEDFGILVRYWCCAQEPALRQKLYQANFHTTLSGEAMVCCCWMAYHLSWQTQHVICCVLQALRPVSCLKSAMLTFLGCHILQVTLVYHRPLDAAWEEAAKGLRNYFAQVGAD